MAFPLKDIRTTDLFVQPVYDGDLGGITRGMFTQYKRVEINTLMPRQEWVNGGTLNFKMKGKGFTVPCVVITHKGNILIDGHHTTIVKKLKGQKYIMANCYNLTS